MMKFRLSLGIAFALFLFCISNITLISCGTDDDKPLDKTLFTVYIPAGSVDLRYDTWFFLTDNDGNLLGIQEAVDGLNMIFQRPSGFKSKKFIVHKVVYELGEDESYADFVFTTYTGIAGGEIRLQPINTNGGTVVGEHHLTVTGVPAGYFPSVVDNHLAGASFNGTGGNFTGHATLLENNVPLMYWWKHPGDRTKIPKYAFISEAVAGETLTTTFAELTPATEIVYDFGASIDRVEFNVSPYIPGEGYVSPFEYFSQTNVTSSKLYCPGTTFNSYNAYIRLTDGDQGQASHTIGAIPASIKLLPATINSFSTDADRFTVSTTGTYDYLYVFGFSEWTTGVQEHWLTWYVFMDDTSEKTFKIPPFPAALTERYPELLTATKNFYSVLINDSDNLNGYNQYMESTWGVKSFPLFTENLSRSRSFSAGGRRPTEQNVRTKSVKRESHR